MRMNYKQDHKISHELHNYMQFRAAKEGVEHDLYPSFYREHILAGCDTFFGVEVNQDGLVSDVQNPEALKEWLQPAPNVTSEVSA
jgi:hypothetical protein